MNYLERIKAISKINISKICKELNINRSNLLNGRTTPENEKRVCQKLIEEYNKVINYDGETIKDFIKRIIDEDLESKK